MTVDEKRAVDTLRVLAMDAVQQAGNGHPGTPMALAPIAYVLWSELMKFDPEAPSWPDRDRFVLSNGHACMLLYGALHLAGYAISLDDIKHLRRWGSRTPGHPERGLTPGVEVTTGPLGQGVANAVGMAMAEAILARRFTLGDTRLVDHRTWALCSDGDLMEGVVSEAASLAGHLKLRKLAVIYDANGITIDGPASLAFSENVRSRFEAYGWRTTEVADADDLTAVRRALWWAAEDGAEAPSLIVVHSHIARGAPHLEDSEVAHGSPLGDEEVAATKRVYGWDPDAHFLVPSEAYAAWRRGAVIGQRRHREWSEAMARLCDEQPKLAAEWEADASAELAGRLDELAAGVSWDGRQWSTREASGRVLAELASALPWIVGGSGDLTSTTYTGLPGAATSSPGSVAQFTHFGVREHGMAAICNGIAAHAGLRPYCSTFLVFSDYMRPSIRLASLMGLPVIYVFTHDSIGLAGDGPTHQPIEHLASLRAIPNLWVMRPADAREVAVAWKLALERRTGPTALVLSRQDLPLIEGTAHGGAEGARRGAYIVAEASGNAPRLVLLASGSEVWVSLAARRILEAEGIPTQVVSMPCWELLEAQAEAYREQVLRPGSIRVAVEAAAALGWSRWVGEDGETVAMNRFGACGQGTEVLERFGFTPQHVADVARAALLRCGSRQIQPPPRGVRA